MTDLHDTKHHEVFAGMGEHTVRVLVCDDEPLVREGLKVGLRDPDIQIVGEVARRRLSAEEAKRSEADVVLVGGGCSTEAADDSSRYLPDVAEEIDRPLAVIIEPTDRQLFLSCVQAGVRGFISTRTAVLEVSQAVHAMATNNAYLSPSLARHHLDWFASKLHRDTGRVKNPTASLSARETEVLKLLGDGLSNAKIAKILRIREVTVRSHVHHILNKLNLQSRTDAVLYGFQLNLDSD